MPELPQSLRAAIPARAKNDALLRSFAISAGLIPPRTLHSPAEAETLAGLARGATRVVELGVYEAASARIFIRVMPAKSELHLIDPFIDESGWALPAGWGATPRAAKAVVRRATAAAGAQAPTVRWQIARSQDAGRAWRGGPVDLVFIDGDHSPEGCREDWEVWSPHVRSGGHVAFHDARLSQPAGSGSVGPTAVVDALFRPDPPPGWSIAAEVDTLFVVTRDPA